MSRFQIETLRALVSTESSMDTWTGQLKMTWLTKSFFSSSGEMPFIDCLKLHEIGDQILK